MCIVGPVLNVVLTGVATGAFGIDENGVGVSLIVPPGEEVLMMIGGAFGKAGLLIAGPSVKIFPEIEMGGALGKAGLLIVEPPDEMVLMRADAGVFGKLELLFVEPPAETLLVIEGGLEYDVKGMGLLIADPPEAVLSMGIGDCSGVGRGRRRGRRGAVREGDCKLAL